MLNNSATIAYPTKRQTLALVTIGTAAWIAAMMFGQLIVLATGVPASSAAINGFVVPFILVFGIQAVPVRWSTTIAFMTYGLLAVPTVLLGPPGPHKVLVSLFAGVGTDILRILLARTSPYVKNLIAFSCWGAMLAFLALGCYYLLPLPGKAAFEKAFIVLTIIFVVEAFLGSLCATYLFQKRNWAQHPTVIQINLR